MKVTVIGIGQCGTRIADTFYSYNKIISSWFFFSGRNIEIITDSFAINTDEADLSGLKHIPKDAGHRILIGGLRTFGHGVGGINRIAFEVIKEQAPSIANIILSSRKFHLADAILLVASGGGGTGSGAIGQLIYELKNRISEDRPVYAMIVLPFNEEESSTEGSFATINTATSLKVVSEVADAVFLIENERYRYTRDREGSFDLLKDIHAINSAIVENFIDLFCAGEEKGYGKIGAKTLDAGDIRATLEKFTAIGRSCIPFSVWRSLKKSLGGSNFHESLRESQILTAALRQAIHGLSIKCDLKDATKICYLICSPRDIVTTGTRGEIVRELTKSAPMAEIRGGDYPGRRNVDATFTLIVSGLLRIERVEKIYTRAQNLYEKQRELIERKKEEFKKTQGLSADLPTLLERT